MIRYEIDFLRLLEYLTAVSSVLGSDPELAGCEKNRRSDEALGIAVSLVSIPSKDQMISKENAARE